MANYQYDESGVLASYFILTFLTLILIPLTLSFLPSRSHTPLNVDSCQCKECQDKARRLKKATSIFKPRLGFKSVGTLAGWALFAFLAYKVATTEIENKLYDPFEILGLRHGTPEKDIKRHYKKLSLKFHPDKVKLAENQTIEEVSAFYVNLTKAYKSLTDDEIRSNLEKFGHPDGKQEFSMGLALPSWVVASQNNFWVLGLYGLIFAGLLPMFVGRWWFGSRKYTKDGVLSSTAQLFFKNVREESSQADLVLLIARAWELEESNHKAASGSSLAELEASIKASSLGSSYGKTPQTKTKAYGIVTRRSLALLYAHMLRITVHDPLLQKELDELLVATPTYLNSMLSMALAHNWLTSSINVMHLQAHLVQGTLPGSSPLLAFPGVDSTEVPMIEGGIAGLVKALEEKRDPSYSMVKQVADKWGKLEVMDCRFRVIGERIVTPGAIVQTIFKLRITPPTLVLPERPQTPEPTPEERKKEVREEEEKEIAFLNDGKSEAEALLPGLTTLGFAHAPQWPANRKPTWWVMIGDQKLNKVIVPPTRISEVPYANPSKAPKDYRKYKLQFQAPPQTGVYTFQLLFISDTFVGEDVRMFLPLKVEDLSALSEEEQMEEDDISDPDEDTLAGQMAAMRGEKVKRSPYHGDDDDESSTDDDQSEGDGTDSSDSDSD